MKIVSEKVLEGFNRGGDEMDKITGADDYHFNKLNDAYKEFAIAVQQKDDEKIKAMITAGDYFDTGETNKILAIIYSQDNKITSRNRSAAGYMAGKPSMLGDIIDLSWNDGGYTARENDYMIGNDWIFYLLLENGMSPYTENGQFDLFAYAALYNNVELFKYIAENYDYDPNSVSYNELKYVDMDDKLINTADNSILTYIFVSKLFNQKNYELVKYLIETKGANINHQNAKGTSCLMFAAKYSKNEKMLAYLYKHGANPELRDNEGKNLLLFAGWDNNHVAMKTYIARTSPSTEVIDVQSDNGKTTLNWLCSSSFNARKSLDFMMALGADPTIPDNAGNIPFDNISNLGGNSNNPYNNKVSQTTVNSVYYYTEEWITDHQEGGNITN